MRRIITWSLLVLIATVISAYGQTTEKKTSVQAPADKSWRNDMAAFASAVAAIAKKAEIPNDFQLTQSLRSRNVFSQQDGTSIWVVLKDGFGKELHGELARSFVGKVSWTGKVTSAEVDQEKRTCNVGVEFPKATAMPDNLVLSDVFLVIPFDKLPTDKLPKVGTTFSFTGNLKKAKDDDPLDRVWVLYGQGPNAGKNRIGVSITDEAPTMK
ncbi:MAG: hypothetical protein HY879_12555 [Deltaproteobacteria bacterium]|nr:hypothetical protein [Deltaproteobacteria bacterium]